MKNIIKKLHNFVNKNYDYGFYVEWNPEYPILGVGLMRADDDFDGEYVNDAGILEKKLIKEFDCVTYVSEPSEYEVECLDVPQQVFIEVDMDLKGTEWVDRHIEVGSEWDGLFYDEREDFF